MTDAAQTQPAKVADTKPAPAPNQATMSPQERWLADRDAANRADPFRDTSKVLTRDAAGNLVQREKLVNAEGEPVPGKPVDQPGADGEAPSADGDAKHKFGDLELTESQIRDLVAHKAETDSRKALVPATSGEYKLELSKDLTLPEGASFQVASPNDPIKGPALKAAQDWAHKNNLSQGQFSELLGLYAAAQSREQILISNAARAEREKLGVTGGARVDAISMFLRGRYGDTAALPMINTLVTEGQVKIWEDVITRVSTQGGGGFRQTGREIDSGKVDDATYNSWTYGQQKEYAERMTALRERGGR